MARCGATRLRYLLLHTAAQPSFHARAARLCLPAAWPGPGAGRCLDGDKGDDALVRERLNALIERDSTPRLARLGGTAPISLASVAGIGPFRRIA
jgi:hypothetical protein